MRNFILLSLFCGFGLLAQEKDSGTVSVTLVNGARLTAPVLRQNSENIVLDLGYDVMLINKKQILDIKDENEKSTNDKIVKDGIFSETIGSEIPRLLFKYLQNLEQMSFISVEGILTHFLVPTMEWRRCNETDIFWPDVYPVALTICRKSN